MAERFREAMRNPPPFSNAQDPDADRMGAYPEGGELDSPQDGADRQATGPRPPQPAGIDTEVILTGGSGRPVGGPAATDPPGQAPGMPPADRAEPEDPGEAPSGPVAERDKGSFVDRLDR